MNSYLLWPLFMAGFAFAAAFAGSGDVLYGAFWGFVVGCPVLGITRLYALTDDEADGKGLDVVAGLIGVMAGGAFLGGMNHEEGPVVLLLTPVAAVSAYGASYLLLAALALVVGRRGAIVGGCVLAGVGVPLWWWFNF